jgi:hypothetical protein
MKKPTATVVALAPAVILSLTGLPETASPPKAAAQACIAQQNWVAMYCSACLTGHQTGSTCVANCDEGYCSCWVFSDPDGCY